MAKHRRTSVRTQRAFAVSRLGKALAVLATPAPKPTESHVAYVLCQTPEAIERRFASLVVREWPGIR